MKKKNLSSGILFIILFIVPLMPSFAANSQQNTQSVEKALIFMKKGLMSQNTNYKQYKTGKVVDFKVTSKKLIIHFTDKITYHIFSVNGDSQMFVIDMLNPINVFCKKTRCEYTTKNSKVFSKIVTAYHSTKKMYGVKYFRIVGHFRKDIASKKIYPKIDLKANTLTILFNLKPKTHHLHKSVKLKKRLSKVRNFSENALKKQADKIPFAIKKVAYTLKTSLQSISCIVSPYDIKEVLYSKESGIQVQVIDKNVFVKPLPKKVLMPDSTMQYIYPDGDKDIYIVTSEKVYALNLVPTKMPSVTYILSPKQHKVFVMDKSNTKKGGIRADDYPPLLNSNSDKGFSYVEKVDASSYVSYLLSLINNIYNHKIPDGFMLYPYHRSYKYIQILVNGKYMIKGNGYIIYVFSVKALKDVKLSNSQFINLFSNPLAVDIIKPKLNAGDTTMLYIITRGGDNE